MNLLPTNRLQGGARRAEHRDDASSPRTAAVVRVGASQPQTSSDRPPARAQAAGESTEDDLKRRPEARSVVESARQTLVNLQTASADSIQVVEGFRRMRELADRFSDPDLSAGERELVEVEYLELKHEMARVVAESNVSPPKNLPESIDPASLPAQAQASASATLRLLK